MRINRLQIRIALVAIGIVAIVGFVRIYNLLTQTEIAGKGAPTVPVSTSREGESKTDDILTKLKPGMLRVDVESLLGPPSSVESVKSANGKLIYRATFTRDRLRPPLPPLLLEFDASVTGHPLLVARIP